MSVMGRDTPRLGRVGLFDAPDSCFGADRAVRAIFANNEFTRSQWTVLRYALAALSFAVYVVVVVLLDQPRTIGWPVEAANAFPAGISFSVYGAPLGTVTDNVSNIFAETYRQGSRTAIQEAFERTATGQASGGHPVQTYDGIGPGYTLFAAVAMLIFGPHIPSVVYGFLLLSGLASFCYALRFRDDRLLLVPLQYLALTTMVLTPMVTRVVSSEQVPIGGYRSFVLLALLPGLHIYFEMIDRAREAIRPRRRDLLTAVQAAILISAILVRASVAYILVPAAAAWLWSVWGERRNRPARIGLYRKAAAPAIAAVVMAGTFALAMPAYLKEGRELGNVWHRAFISIGLHPEFPFGDIAREIDCRNTYAGALRPDLLDSNGHCVWFAYLTRNGRPETDRTPGMFGPEYERALRDGLFKIIAAYPRQAFELYFYYKPKVIAATLLKSLNLSMPNMAVAWLVGLQWLVFSAFAVATMLAGSVPATPRLGFTLAIDFLLSMAPGIVAWSTLGTAADIIFFMYCLIGFAAAAGLAFLGGKLRGIAGFGGTQAEAWQKISGHP